MRHRLRAARERKSVVRKNRLLQPLMILGNVFIGPRRSGAMSN